LKNTFIHETANVAANAMIGNDTKIWINVQIREGSTIGAHCILSKDVYIDHGVTIGDYCKIQNSVSVYSGVTIEDEVFVGPCVAFTNDYYPRAQNPNWEIVPTRIKRGASLGANCTVVCGHTVGEYAMIGAGSVVVSDVKPFALAVGNPAKQIGRVCKCGQRADEGICPKCGFVLPGEDDHV
jgi:acetyltransferase-like isoleucine patch superfamily enzyme